MQVRTIGLLREEVVPLSVREVLGAQPHTTAAAFIEHIEELHREGDACIGVISRAVAAERVAILREEALQIICRAELQSVQRGKVNLRIHRCFAGVLNGELKRCLRRLIHLHRHRTTQRQRSLGARIGDHKAERHFLHRIELPLLRGNRFVRDLHLQQWRSRDACRTAIQSPMQHAHRS